MQSLMIIKTGLVLITGLAASWAGIRIHGLASRRTPERSGKTGAPAAARRRPLRQRVPDMFGSLRDRTVWAVLILCGLFILTGKAIVGLLAAIVFLSATGRYRRYRERKTKEEFADRLSEALGMVANSMRAGQSLTQAMESMTREIPPPVSTAFQTALREVRLGASMNEALERMAEGVASPDLRIAVTSIIMARETGGNLGEVLLRIAGTIRERRKIQGRINALTSQGRLSGSVMAATPFLLLGILYLMEPGMMGLLFSTLQGNILLLVATVMVMTGSFFIEKIVDIDI